MKHFSSFVASLLLVMSALAVSLTVSAQQLPNASFEDWSGTSFDGNIQPALWNYSNVEQVGMKFNFAHRETGRTGYCAMVQNQSVGAMGITETTPGYFALGTPWQYLPSVTQVSSATGGTDGGLTFSYRPDSMYVWIKRTGSAVTNENFSILFYSWKGTSKGTKYLAKNGSSCTNTGEHTNEESDIRQALDANSCGTTTKATQVAEGLYYEKKEYSNWTQIKVPIYYMNDEVPQKCNVIFSAAGYPNFRTSSGLNVGNSLYVDDISLIYSSKIQHLYIGGKEWKGFDPNSSAEQTYSVGRTTTIPEIYATRGEGSITNMRGTKVAFAGRRLSDSEISISNGQVDGAATVITVTAADGSSTTTYRIKFVQDPSDNPRLNSILVNGEPLTGFNGYVSTYNVSLPYGTTATPVVSYVLAEDGQTATITQASSTTGTATIQVTAPDGKTKMTYTLNFSVALLSDNTLRNILVNGDSITGFIPSLTTYRVELPLGTTTMPTVVGVSNYPAGEQTITYTAPSQIDGGQYQVSVTTPGNSTAKVYKLNFKVTASTNSKLQDLKMGDYITSFNPNSTTYYVNLPMGTTELPEITYVQGDRYQTVSIEEGGVDGITLITVTAANGDQTIYKIICQTDKSEASHLEAIYLDGELLEGFDANITSYTVNLPLGTSELPAITWQAADQYETVTLTTGGLNGQTKLTVVAGNGNTTIYKIQFSVEQATDATLNMIYVGGEELPGFSSEVYEYSVVLPKGTTTLPAVTYDQHDEWQTVTVRSGGINGDYKLTVRPQSGASATYILHFSVETSAVNTLSMIYLSGVALEGFDPEVTEYTDTLPAGVSTLPTVTYTKTDESATDLMIARGNIYTIRVTAEDGSQRTYTITFVLRKSANAFLQMIYLDGEPLQGFAPDELSYAVELDGDSAPAITVDKEASQQVTIVAPVLEGTALVKVTSESGDANTYTIRFYLKTSEEVMLQAIQLDGVNMAAFDGATLNYDLNYTTDIPVVTWTAAEGQTVTKLQEKEDVRLFVAAEGKSAVYTLSFHKQYSSDASLSAILLDGTPLSGFAAETHDYLINLAAGSSLPVITYQTNHDAQVVTLGQVAKNNFALKVVAEDGTEATYTLTFTIADFTSTELVSIALDGVDMPLTAGVYSYSQPLAEGADLPVLTYEKGQGQTVLSANVSDHEQQLLVIAQDGSMATYTISYLVSLSDDALLSDIKVGGVSMEGFSSTHYNYSVTLPWRTTLVPNITPVSRTAGQTITVNYSAVNGTTTIHVVAADKIHSADYSIAFPVVKSSNTKLEYVDFEDLTFDFDPEQNDYVINLPYQTKAVPFMSYAKQEPEQTVEYINAPITETSHLIVTAENGDTRDYSFTFNVPLSDKANILSSITITETGEVLTPTESDDAFTIDLPYGTSSMNVTYVKNFDEQTVLVQPGGLFNPTVITVKANRGEEADKVYTLTPNLDTQNPAVLESISVNGTPIDGFDKNRFSYIVNVTSAPVVTYSGWNGALVIPDEVTTKHWKAHVQKGDYTNTYELWFYYTADVIPNANLDIDGVATYNNAYKPQGWNTIADADDSYLTVKSGAECTKASDGSVYLKTQYRGMCARNIPAFMTLGTVSGTINLTNSFSYSGSITFRNSPDVLTVRYKAPTIHDNNHIIYELWGSKGYKVIDSQDTQSFSSFKEKSIDLSSANEAGYPTAMNIVLNSYYDTQGGLGTEGFGTVAEMYVDWLRFSYNSALSGVKINGADATKSGTTFTYTLPSSEDTSLPMLTFTGEVSDQAQLISWSEESAEGVRTASVTNYAENGTSTNYVVRVTRPLSTIDTLATILVDGDTISGWKGDSLNYTVSLPFGTKNLPSVQPVHASNLQTVVTALNDKVVSITVTPESGEAKTYTVTFVEQKSADVTLAGLAAAGLTPVYDPEVTEYAINAATMSDVTFVKSSDGQKVTLQPFAGEEGQGAKLFVVAEDGETQGTITITLNVPVVTTSGLLSDISFDDLTIEGFSPTTFLYEKAEPTITSFRREYAQDSVVFTMTPDSMKWEVYGSENHTYKNIYPTSPSSVATLADIIVNGVSLPEFLEAEKEYTLNTNDPLDISLLPHDGETLVISSAVSTSSPMRSKPNKGLRGEHTTVFTIAITAEDGLATDNYSLTIAPQLSDNAALAMISLDDVDLASFDPDTLNYTVVLPASDPKLLEPQMPSVTYLAGDEAQSVVVDQVFTPSTGGIGQSSMVTYFSVYPEDGSPERVYMLTVEAEPSHNADLTGIMLDGTPLPSFASDRHFYSARVEDLNVEVDYSTEDRFQTITTSLTGNLFTVHVVAQDGVTANDYQIELYAKTLSQDVTLANLLLDGKTFTDYRSDLTPFTPMNNVYTITLATDAQVPDVQGVLNSAGQQMDIRQAATTAGTDVMIDVTAEDGVTTNTYTLHFVFVRSTNTDLSMIYIGSEALADFVPNKHDYLVNLPVGTKRPFPTVSVVEAEVGKQVLTELTVDSLYTVTVLAEDGQTSANYTVQFNILLSAADTLLMLTEDNEDMPGFAPHTFYYQRTIAAEARTYPAKNRFPMLDYEKAYPGQQVRLDTISYNDYALTYQVVVVAENGAQNRYTVVYEQERSTVDTVAMITVDNRPLEGFDPYKNEYTITQPYGTFGIPAVDCEPGDNYQDTTIVQQGKDVLITVTAESGTVRTYTLHFVTALSNDATLLAIGYGDTNIDPFDPEQTTYNIVLPYGTKEIPIISYIGSDSNQIIQMLRLGDVVLIQVTAADGETTMIYMLNFTVALSPEAHLSGISVGEEALATFEPDLYEYEVVLPYGTTEMPEVAYTLADTTATATVEVGEHSVTISVASADEEHYLDYVVTFSVEKCPIDWLEAISVRGEALEDFDKDSTEYVLTYPVGSDETALATVDDISFVRGDETETVEVQANGSTLTVQVIAENGANVRVYVIRQVILLSDDSRLADLTLNGVTITGFADSIYSYTYLLLDGETLPLVEAQAADTAAEVAVTMGAIGEETYIYCTAEDGSETVYTIHFTLSPINTGADATSKDVLIKQIAGTEQFAAYSIRVNTWLAIYDHNGSLVLNAQLPVCNPNDVTVTTDAAGRDLLVDAQGEGVYFTLPTHGGTYLYLFYSDGKRLDSGKMMVR